jgi:hypothetical protein
MGGKAMVIRPLADFLHAYQLDGGYTPGPLYLAATVLGLLGTLSLIRLRRRRRRQPDPAAPPPADRELALACCLFFLSAAAILLVSDFTEFSWRYQLPAIMTLPPAGALGLAVLLARFRGRRGRQAAGGPLDARTAGTPAMRTSPDQASPDAAAPGQATPTR